MARHASFNGTILLILAVLGSLVVMDLVTAQFDPATQERMLSEEGIFEMGSALGYLLAAALLLFFMASSGNRRSWPLVGILLAMSGREFDLDKKLFTEGLFKSRQYLGDQVPLAERLAALVILLAILTCLWVAARRYGPGFLRGLRDGVRADWLVATGLMLAVLSKAVDGLNRKLEPLGLRVSDEVARAASRYEEIAELGIPISFILAIFSAHRARTTEIRS